jgi:PKD repeat protein
MALGAWLILFTGSVDVSVALPGWSLQTNLVEGPEREHATASVAMDGKGDTLVAWNEPVGGYEAIEVAWRPAGGTFEKPIAVSPIGVRAFSPAVAMNSRGDATVAWLWLPLGGFPGEGIIDVATRSAGGAFTAPVQIAGSDSNAGLDIAMDQGGDTTIAWTHYNDAYHLVQGSTRPAGGAFSKAVTLSGASDGGSENVSATGPTIAMDSSGDTTIAWSASALNSEYRQIAPFYSQISTKLAGGNFSSPPTSLSVKASEVAGNPSGEALLAWQSYNAGTLKLEGAFRPTVHDSFGEPLTIFSEDIGESEAASTYSAATLDAVGETTAVIETLSSMMTTTRPVGGSFSKPAVVAEGVAGMNSQPRLVTDEGGDSTLMWLSYGGDHPEIPVIESASRPAGGQFGPVLRLATGPNSQPPNVAIDAYGDSATAWISSDGTTQQLHFAGYQAAGPRLEAVQAPAEGQAGEALSFSTAPLSVFSEVASTTWSWGDGSPSSSGVQVDHKFAAPGAYRVSLTATDALGNSTTTTRTVLVTAATNVEVGQPRGLVNSAAPHVPAKPPRVSAELVAKPFTPLFATQASTKKQSLGRVVAIAKVRGVADGDTIVVRCLVACARPLHLIRHISSRHNRGGAFAISPPLVVTRATRIRVAVLTPRHVPRFVDYRFGRSSREVVPHPTLRGCLSSAGTPRPCP